MAPLPSGAEVHAGAGVGEAREVALEHGDVGEQPVGDEDWLGALEVGVAGHDVFGVGFGEGDEGVGPFDEAARGAVDGVADEETHVGGDLFVARAAGVELEGEGADLFGEFELDEVVDVLGLRGGGYDGRADLLVGSFVVDLARCGRDAVGPVDGAFAYEREAAEGLLQLVLGEDAGGGDGLRMGLAGGDLLREETPVEGEAALPLLEGAVEGLAETAGPHFCGLFVSVHRKFCVLPCAKCWLLVLIVWNRTAPKKNSNNEISHRAADGIL